MKQKIILYVKLENAKDKIAVRQLIGGFPYVDSVKPMEGADNANKFEIVGTMINTHRLMKKLRKFSKDVHFDHVAPNGKMGLPFMAGPMFLPPPPLPPQTMPGAAPAQMTMTPYGPVPIVMPPVWPTSCFTYSEPENGAQPTHPFNPPPPPQPPLIPIGGGGFGELAPSQGGYGYPPPYNPYYYGHQPSNCTIL